MSLNLESSDKSLNLLPILQNDLLINSPFKLIDEDFDIFNFPLEYYDNKPYKEILSETNYEKAFLKSTNFIISKKKFRGKQSNNYRKVKHLSNSIDNILTKIQVHFFSFIIGIANDALFTEFKDKNTYNFKGIIYKEKAKFNFLLFEKYKKFRIKDILELKISPKFKLFQIDHNKQLLNKVCNLSNWLDKLFDMNYLKLFNYYYNNRKPLNAIFFEGKEIKLSKRTKNFYYLLEKNKNNEVELIQIVESYYFNDFCLYKKE
jgi:hypothetical protein